MKTLRKKTRYHNGVIIVKENERFMKYQKQNVISLAHRQLCLKKKFKDVERFLKMIKEFGISKSAIIFKMFMQMYQ